jgi:hypothetical protein
MCRNADEGMIALHSEGHSETDRFKLDNFKARKTASHFHYFNF